MQSHREKFLPLSFLFWFLPSWNVWITYTILQNSSTTWPVFSMMLPQVQIIMFISWVSASPSSWLCALFGFSHCSICSIWLWHSSVSYSVSIVVVLFTCTTCSCIIFSLVFSIFTSVPLIEVVPSSGSDGRFEEVSTSSRQFDVMSTVRCDVRVWQFHSSMWCPTRTDIFVGSHDLVSLNFMNLLHFT